MADFADRKCEPCEGGVAPLTAAQAGEAMRQLHDDWNLGADGKSISRTFDFPAFSRTIAFTNAVAWIATVEGHHPEMTVSYGRCVVSYKTTAIDGLSDNDCLTWSSSKTLRQRQNAWRRLPWKRRCCGRRHWMKSPAAPSGSSPRICR
jgi:4a-hydroxytetrahydrobiopterin dehydratase